MIIGAAMPDSVLAQGAAGSQGTTGSAIDKALGKTLDTGEVDALHARPCEGSADPAPECGQKGMRGRLGIHVEPRAGIGISP